MMNGRPARILIIAPMRFPIRRPHAGGLEAAVWSEADALIRRGHDVTLIAVRGSDHVRRGSVFELPTLQWPPDAHRTDSSYPAGYDLHSVPALRRALDWVVGHPERFDVISNHSLHSLPLSMAPLLGVPMVTTLHTPVDGDFVRAHAEARGMGSRFLSVSEHTRRSWAQVDVPSKVLPNGVDPDVWSLGAGGDDLVWFGRIVPEKAPHVAVDVARRTGRKLTIAGRIGDRGYAEDVLFPLLGDGVTYAGP